VRSPDSRDTFALFVIATETGAAAKHVQHSDYGGDDEEDDVHGGRHGGFLSADG